MKATAMKTRRMRFPLLALFLGCTLAVTVSAQEVRRALPVNPADLEPPTEQPAPSEPSPPAPAPPPQQPQPTTPAPSPQQQQPAPTSPQQQPTPQTQAPAPPPPPPPAPKPPPPPKGTIKLTDAEAQKIGKLIWRNECGGTISGLTTWNKGEEFPSLGIAHFIWYPPGKEYKFQESFPGYLVYAQQNGAKLPAWLANNPGQSDSPWTTKAKFDFAKNKPKMTELRKFLADTVPIQARYAALRAEQALPKLLAAAPESERADIKRKFYTISKTPGGVYALIDYVNFKGEGTNPKERYKGEGWGLLQALELSNIPDGSTPNEALASFRLGAIDALARRIRNSPKERGESRWMKGWTNRINTYKN